MSRTYHNRYPRALAQEMEAARRVGAAPVEVPSDAFDALIAEEDRMIYVVAGGRLLVSKRLVLGEHISHAVIADGEPVQAAGEFEVVEEQEATVVSILNNMSGHYRPAGASLTAAQEAFEAAGLRIRPGGVHGYDLQAS